MENLKAIWNITQHLLLLAAGITSMALSTRHSNIEELQFTLFYMGVALAVIAGAPIVWEFIKAKMPKRIKKDKTDKKESKK